MIRKALKPLQVVPLQSSPRRSGHYLAKEQPEAIIANLTVCPG